METNDLRKAAEMALEFMSWLTSDDHSIRPHKAPDIIKALRQALAYEALDEMVAENQRLGLYDDAFTLDRGCYERGCVAYDERDGDGVNINDKRVHKIEKSVHESIDWEAVAADQAMTIAMMKLEKRDSSSWVGLTRRELDIATLGLEDLGDCYIAIEAKLKEKNGG